MKRFLALLLVVALTACFAVVASAADPQYTDVVNLLPTDASKVSQVDGTTEWSVDGGKLTIAMAEGSNPAWPSVELTEAAGKEIDLSATPYLHLDFTVPETTGEAGINGMIYYTEEGSTEAKTAQLSMVATGKADDFRGTTSAYYDFSKFAGTTGKITITKVTLSIYVWKVTWNTLAFAKEGVDEPSTSEPSTSTPSTSTPSTSTPSTSTPSTSTPSTSAPATSSPAASSSGPSTGDAGVLVFAVLGVVAIVGVAVAVKTRH